ncbi:MAG: ATP-binding protein [Clostridium sp.]
MMNEIRKMINLKKIFKFWGRETNAKHKEIEEATLKNLKYLIDNIPYAVWLKDSDGIYKYVNKYYAKLIDMNSEDIIGKNDCEIKDKKSKTFLEISKMTIPNNDSQETMIGGIGKNIKINEDIYREIEKSTLTLLNDRKENDKSELPFILKDILKADDVTIYIFDEDYKKINIFLKTCDDLFLEWDNFEISEKGIQKCMEANEKNRCIETHYVGMNMRGYVRTYLIEFENEFIGILNLHYDNKKSYVYNVIAENIIKSTCERLGIIIKNRKLTNKYKIELQKRKESEKKLQIFLDNSIDFYFETDADNFYFENGTSIEKFQRFLGNNIERVDDVVMSADLRHPDDEKKIEKIYEAVKKHGSVKGFVIRYLCADNEYKSIKWNMQYNEEDNKFYITGKDITSTLKLEKEKIELEKTIEMESLKTDFFANMSHEFKTPLNIILTTVQILSDKLTNSENKCNSDIILGYLKGIKQNSYRLLKIVNNVMDITKIDSRSYDLELGNYNIVSIVEDIVLSVAEYLNQNKRNIVFDTVEEEIMLACDPIKIERIMLNLLSNALKYTDEDGNIEVLINIDKEKNEAVISVENDGAPIPHEDKERIFERFTQSESLFTRKAEGTGIGLFLVKLLVELHGGRIFVDTSESKKTKFVFVLPIRLIEAKKENYAYTKQIVSKVETCNIEFSDIYSI